MAKNIIYTGGAGPNRIKAGGKAFVKGIPVAVDDEMAAKLLTKRFFTIAAEAAEKKPAARAVNKEV